MKGWGIGDGHKVENIHYVVRKKWSLPKIGLEDENFQLYDLNISYFPELEATWFCLRESIKEWVDKENPGLWFICTGGWEGREAKWKWKKYKLD